MKKIRKKIGTIMEERLLFEAKKAALEQAVPFHRFVEQAVERYILEGKARPEKTKIPKAAGISEKSSGYFSRPRIGGTPPFEQNGDLTPHATAPYAIPLEERWKRLLETAGKYHSGRKDISIRHDDYAAEAFTDKE